MNLNISGVTQQAAGSAAATNTAAPANRTLQASTQAAQETASAAQDKVTLSGKKTEPVTYADPRTTKVQPPAAADKAQSTGPTAADSDAKVAKPDLQAMLEESERKAQAVIDLIRPLIADQGLNVSKLVSGEQQIKVDAATREAAQAAIAEGGELSVENVANRILDFAKGVVGDDASKFDTIRAAVEKGFDEAKSILGGTLPDISEKTHAAVQAGFDSWKKEAFPDL